MPENSVAPAGSSKFTGWLRTGVDVGASLAMLGVAALLAWQALKTKPDSPPLTGQPVVSSLPVSLEDRLMEGSDTAPVAMLVVSEFQCPFCAAFANDVLPFIRSTYVDSGHVRLGFRHFPLKMHTSALPAARAAECAARQGKFRAVHDQLFQLNGALSEQAIQGALERAGVTSDLYDRCISTVDPVIQSDMSWAAAFKVAGTPTFIFGTRLDNSQMKVTHAFSGSRDRSAFVEILDELVRTR